MRWRHDQACTKTRLLKADRGTCRVKRKFSKHEAHPEEPLCLVDVSVHAVSDLFRRVADKVVGLACREVQKGLGFRGTQKLGP